MERKMKKLTLKDLATISFFENGGDIDDDGNVFGTKGKQLNPSNRKNYNSASTYYKRIGVWYNGNTVEVKVHRLQAFKKFGYEMFGEGIVVRHLNNFSLDNSVDNIAIGTIQDNANDIPHHARVLAGIKGAETRKKNRMNKEDE